MIFKTCLEVTLNKEKKRVLTLELFQRKILEIQNMKKELYWRDFIGMRDFFEIKYTND